MMGVEDVQEFLDTILSSAEREKELEALGGLYGCLLEWDKVKNGTDITSVIPKQEHFNKLLLRLVQNIHGKERHMKISPDVSTRSESLLKWFLKLDISSATLDAFRFCMKQAQDQPALRKEICLHFLIYLKDKINDSLPPDVFTSIKMLLLDMVTDVWSAIRSSCVKKLETFLCKLNTSRIQELFHDLVQVCQNGEATWQAKHGAIMAISSVICRFSPVMTVNGTGCYDETDLGTDVDIMPLPAAMQTDVHHVVFSLASHDQLCIRDEAVRVYSSYLDRCDTQTALRSLSEVLQCLNNGDMLKDEEVPTKDHAQPEEETEEAEEQEKASSSDHQSKLLADYEAESLLGLFNTLTRKLPEKEFENQLLSSLTAVKKYLGHPASSVRQAGSTCFQQIMSRLCTPHVVRQLLQELTSVWSVSGQLSQDKPGCWQAQEGCLLTYDLILQLLLEDNYQALIGVPGLPERTTHSKPVSATSLLISKPAQNGADETTATESLLMALWRTEQAVGADLKVLGQLLVELYQQTSQGLVCGQWEVRRMASQVLPVLVEVMCWYDITRLQTIWSHDLSADTSLPCYSSCLALKYTLDLIGHLLQFTKSEQITWKVPAAASHLVTHIQRSLVDCLSFTHLLLQRTEFSILSVVAIEIMMFSHVYFPISQDQMLLHSSDIIQHLLLLYIMAHPDSPLTSDLQEIAVCDDDDVSVCLSGHLSYPHVSSSSGQLQAVKKAEQYTWAQLHEILLLWLHSRPVEQTFQLMPVMAQMAVFHVDHDVISKMATESLSILSVKIVEFLSSSAVDADVSTSQDAVRHIVVLCLQLCPDIFNLPSAGVSTVRQLLVSYGQLWAAVPNQPVLEQIVHHAHTKLGIFKPEVEESGISSKSQNIQGHTSSQTNTQDDDSAESSDWDSDEEAAAPGDLGGLFHGWLNFLMPVKKHLLDKGNLEDFLSGISEKERHFLESSFQHLESGNDNTS